MFSGMSAPTPNTCYTDMIYWIHLIKIDIVFTQITSLMLMVIQMQWTRWVGTCCSANLGLISDQGRPWAKLTADHHLDNDRHR